MKRTIDQTLDKIYDLALGNAAAGHLESLGKGQLRRRLQQIKACVRSYRADEEAAEDAELNRIADERQGQPGVPVTLDELDQIAETGRAIVRRMVDKLAEAGIDLDVDDEPERQVYLGTVEEDPATGDLLLAFPPEMLETLGWGEDTVLIWEVGEDGVSIRKAD